MGGSERVEEEGTLVTGTGELHFKKLHPVLPLTWSQADGRANPPSRQTPKLIGSPTERQTNKQRVKWREKKMATQGFYPMVFELEKNFDQGWARQWVQANWVPLCSSAGFDLILILPTPLLGLISLSLCFGHI